MSSRRFVLAALCALGLSAAIPLVDAQTSPPSSSSLLSSVSVVGAASYCTAVLMQQLSIAYDFAAPTFALSILESDSPGAITAFLNHDADFAMVSSTLSAVQSAANPTVLQLPFVALPVALVYNLPSVASLTLSGRTAALIYLGQVRWWNDSLVQADNPGAALPNASIHVLLQAGGYMSNFVFLTALGQYYPPLLNAIPPSLSPSFPTSAYASFSVAEQLDGASALTLLTPLSLGYSVYGQALQQRVQLAAMYNAEGAAVSISTASVQLAVDYNAIVQVQLYAAPQSTASVELSLESSTGSAWPLVGLQYVLVDRAYARATCSAKSAMAQFLVWIYDSASAAVVLDLNGVFLLPSIVQSALNTVARLQSAVTCRGSAIIPVSASTAVQVSADTRLSSLPTLLTAAFNEANSIALLTSDASYALSSQSNPSALVFDQARYGEVDVGLFFADDIDPALLQYVVGGGAHTIAPLLLVAVGSVFNPQIHPQIDLGRQPVNLSLPIVAAIYGSLITDWSHPAILAINPSLSARFLQLPTPWYAPITVILPCVVGSVGAYASQVLHSAVPSYAQVALGDDLCASTTATPLNASRTVFVASETVMAPAVAATVGSFGYGQLTSFDSAGVVALHTDSGDLVPTASALLACADAIDPSTLLLDVLASSNPLCSPFTQVLYAILPRAYSGASSCTSGRIAYDFLLAQYNTSDHDAVYESQAYVRAALDPTVLGLLQAALSAVTCDAATMLVVSPTVWTLSASIRDSALALSALGLLGCAVGGAALLGGRRRPAVQAAMPRLLAQALLGCAALLCTVVALVLPVTAGSCGFALWGMNGAAALLFAPLYARVFRWHRMYALGRPMQRVDPAALHRIALVPAGLAVPFTALWMAFAPLSPQTTFANSGSTPWAYEQCGFSPADSSATKAFLVAAGFVYGGALLVFSLMAFGVRRLLVPYSDNARVAYVLYNACLALLLLVPIMAVIDAVGDALVLLLVLLLLWLAFAPLLLLLAPLLLHALWPQRSSATAEQPQLSSAKAVSLGFSFLHIGAMSEEVLLQYVEALEQRLQEVRRRATAVEGAVDGVADDGGADSGDLSAGDDSNSAAAAHCDLRRRSVGDDSAAQSPHTASPGPAARMGSGHPGPSSRALSGVAVLR